MEQIIHWLMKIEHIANDIYARASDYFRDNEDLKEFLDHSADDEAAHYHAMGSAAEHYRSRSLPAPSIEVDNETRNRIEGIFTQISKQLDDRSLSEETILTHIVNAEFSEWNDIFLYAISYLKEEVSEFRLSAKKMQNHLRHVEMFMEKSPFGRALLQKLTEIPPVWQDDILIVDDEIMVSELIKAVLHRDGHIDIAENGEEALRKIEEKYYKLVISDVDMPVMDGLTFYRRAVELFPTIKNRFIFITGNPSADKVNFFKTNGLAFLEKPAPINILREEARKRLML